MKRFVNAQRVWDSMGNLGKKLIPYDNSWSVEFGITKDQDQYSYLAGTASSLPQECIILTVPFFITEDDLKGGDSWVPKWRKEKDNNLRFVIAYRNNRLYRVMFPNNGKLRTLEEAYDSHLSRWMHLQAVQGLLHP